MVEKRKLMSLLCEKFSGVSSRLEGKGASSEIIHVQLTPCAKEFAAYKIHFRHFSSLLFK